MEPYFLIFFLRIFVNYFLYYNVKTKGSVPCPSTMISL